MASTVYYTATSLDGFIADRDGSLDWLFRQEQDGSGQLGFDAFLPRIGAVVMGSTTYEWVLAQGVDPWPYHVPTWVLSTRELPRVDGDVRFARGDVRTVHQEMVAVAGERDRWVVGGGELAGQFADAGLLDEVIVTIAPVTLGGGAPLLPRTLDLHLEELERTGGFAAARYTVTGPPRAG